MKTFELKDFVKTKQNSKHHTEEEINFFIRNIDSFTQDEITLWLKAVKANGLSDEETSALTLAMTNSGAVLSWEGLEPTIDKHSTGGIGDKVTLLFAPLMAAYGINIPKLSGRGLGITGGTLDKLESIPGFNTGLTNDQIKEQVKKIGLAIASAGKNLAPAEKKLYVIRDVTDTMDSIPLIASSIMAKKFAGGASNIILDVKYGSGAFMKTLGNAKLLAQVMVQIGKSQNKRTKAVISNMDEPLGYGIGNALEIKEVLDVMAAKRVNDLLEIVIYLASCTVRLVNDDPESDLERELEDLLLNGAALKKFEQMVATQGGNLKAFWENSNAKYITTLNSKNDGFINKIDALLMGEVVHKLGAGRKEVTDKIDYTTGIKLLKKHGDKVVKDEPILEIHAKSREDADNVREKLIQAITFGQNEPSKLKLIEGEVN